MAESERKIAADAEQRTIRGRLGKVAAVAAQTGWVGLSAVLINCWTPQLASLAVNFFPASTSANLSAQKLLEMIETMIHKLDSRIGRNDSVTV